MSTLNDYAIVEKVIHEVCQAHHVTKAMLVGNDRHESVAWPRQIAMTLAFEESGLTQKEVGAVFNRANGTVHFAIHQVHNRVDVYRRDGESINELRSKVKHGNAS